MLVEAIVELQQKSGLNGATAAVNRAVYSSSARSAALYFALQLVSGTHKGHSKMLLKVVLFSCAVRVTLYGPSAA